MIQLAELFQTGMILQRGKELCIWGHADAAAEVTVRIQGQEAHGCAGQKGFFTVRLAPLTTSESETMEVAAGQDHLTITDVAVGEVWLAGGQSNMEFHMRYEMHLDEVKPACGNPRIRFFDVPECAYPEQRHQFDYSQMGVWRKASPEDIEYFSAVGYYFSSALEKELKVPVGIVGCNWGGTACAAWMNPETVKTAGPDWMKDYEDFSSGTDMQAYWARQSTNLLNSRGTPFSDPFGEFIMPRTRTPDELGAFFASLAGGPPELGKEIMVQSIPGSLYENMVKTVAPYAIRGVIWYQGESDDVPGRQNYYQSMLTGMIRDWRSLWNAELPFLIVQLPGFERWMDITCIDYDTIREAQQKVTQTVSDAWLCSISDAGERFDIHPKNKKIVGERLALLAQTHVYDQPARSDAPEAVSYSTENGCIRIHFANTADGLYVAGETISALTVAVNGNQIPVHAKCEADDLVFTPEREIHGVFEIRFAKGSWYQVNLYNSAGIPAVPFSFDVKL